jgi:hypothetical protein
MGLAELRRYARAGYSRTQAAKEIGIPLSTLRHREKVNGWKVGWPPHVQERHYTLHMTLGEWEPVMEYARARGVDAARKKWDLPRGAINAMLNYEWERVS